jgi:hypothetical protein
MPLKQKPSRKLALDDDVESVAFEPSAWRTCFKTALRARPGEAVADMQPQRQAPAAMSPGQSAYYEALTDMLKYDCQSREPYVLPTCASSRPSLSILAGLDCATSPVDTKHRCCRM